MTFVSFEILLQGYASGIFPMADPDEADEIYWYAPNMRGILPLEQFRISKNLRRLIKKEIFEIRFDTAFEAVMRACAARESTWISNDIIRSYTQLHHLGFAHSVECWLEGKLVGGLYGVSLRGAFFGESMFHSVSNASKVALFYLVEHLKKQQFVLLDVQYSTPHLAQFGVVEISKTSYEQKLAEALQKDVSWF